MVDKKKGTFKRKEYPKAKDSKLPDFANEEQLAVIKKQLKRGSAFMVFGSEYSPRKELMACLRLEMKSPTFNGIVAYDANVPYKEQCDRDVITISINDWGNKNYIHSIKVLGPIRSRTLYTYTESEENTDGESSSDGT